MKSPLHRQAFGAMANAREAAQIAVEHIFAGDEHPNRLADYVRDVERWCSHARQHLEQAAKQTA